MICSKNTSRQHPMDTIKRLIRQYAIIIAAPNPTREIHGLSVDSRIAGNVITERVT
jgi:hypothetical protein